MMCSERPMLWSLGSQAVRVFGEALDHFEYVASGALAPFCSSGPWYPCYLDHLTLALYCNTFTRKALVLYLQQQYPTFKKLDGKSTSLIKNRFVCFFQLFSQASWEVIILLERIVHLVQHSVC